MELNQPFFLSFSFLYSRLNTQDAEKSFKCFVTRGTNEHIQTAQHLLHYTGKSKRKQN